MAVVNANPDGYTVLQSGNGSAISVSLFKLPFDVEGFHAGIDRGNLSAGPGRHRTRASPRCPSSSLSQRRIPAKLNIGSTQFLAANIQVDGGYRCAGRAVQSNAAHTSLLGNEVEFVQLLGPVLSHLKSGKLNAGGGLRSAFPALPDIPTLARAASPAITSLPGPGSVPARAACDRRATFREAIATAVPEVRQPLLEMGIEARGSTPGNRQADDRGNCQVARRDRARRIERQ
jgi:hypothetical protein